MANRAQSWHEPKQKYLERIREETGVVLELEGRGSRWASGPLGSIAILASDARRGERWLLGLDEREVEQRRPLGVILLCAAKDALLEFGLSGPKVLELLPKLSRDQARGERKLNLVRRGRRYLLQLPGDDSVDITASLGDLSWLRSNSVVRESELTYHAAPLTEEGASSPPTLEQSFFARVRPDGVLEPLDPTEFPEGAIVRVKAAIAPSVPGIAALRRIVAAGGPSLPRDLAERHDDYAHGRRPR